MVFALVTYIGFNRYVGEAAHRIPPHAAAAHDELHDQGSRITLLLVVFAISVAFWIAFYQNGYTLTFWARDNTITSWPPERFQSVEPLFVILFSPAFAFSPASTSRSDWIVPYLTSESSAGTVRVQCGHGILLRGLAAD